ncbi:MAG TPA: PKD domain-containing protein, partial [Saprospiraceae bacterium]|nr:PKD domain-containing protein [Saprospiraceae bacterium]
GVVLDGGTSSADSIRVEWVSGPSGYITLGAQPCAGAACPVPAQILVPIISDDAQIEGLDKVCPGVEEEYSIDHFGGTNFEWSLSGNGVITSGQGTHRVTVQWGDFPSSVPNVLSVKYESCYLGCKGSDTLAVRVLSPFIISGPVEACELSSATFLSILSFNNLSISANWTLIGPKGTTSWTGSGSSANPNFGAGPGLYRLIAKPADPTQTCSDQAEWSINVPARPAKPSAIEGEKLICPGSSYTYEALGVTPQSNLSWTVQNGPGAALTQSGNPINVLWGNAGPRSLQVVQISTDGLGCQSDAVQLAVAAIATPVIAGKDVVCEDDTATYTIGSISKVDIQWKIVPASAGAIAAGQGTHTVSIFWSQPGGHALEVDVCGQKTLYPVTVVALPEPMVQHPAGLCAGALGLVQTNGSYSQYNWKDADGKVLSQAAQTSLPPGSYAVEVTDTRGCVGTKEFSIQPYPAVNVSLTTADPTGFCNNSEYVLLTALTNADGDFTYQWFQDGTLIGGANGSAYSTNQYGNYTVVATNAQGCTAQAGPILLFNYCDGGGGICQNPGHAKPFCPPGLIDILATPTARCDSFLFSIQDPSGTYVKSSADWIFFISGGSLLGTANVDFPKFTFPNAGKYLISLRLELTNGAVCVVLDSVQVDAKAQFKLSPACPGSATTFLDISTYLPGGGISAWQWDFGDPASGASNSAAVRNPQHTYAQTGIYPAALTVTANSGCTSSATLPAEIPSSTPAVFAPPALRCAGNALEFVASTDPAVTQLRWDFGDPGTGPANDATGSPAYHNFSTPGTYTVTATTYNAYGCTATTTQSVAVTPNALSGNINPGSPAPVCEGKTVTLSAPAGAVAYLWSDSTTTTPTLAVTQTGTYRVTLTDASGCTYAPKAVKVDVIAAPDAVIKALIENDLGQVIGTSYPSLAVCEGEDVHLKAFGDGLGYSYSWSGGNGNSDEVLFTEERGNLLPVGTYGYSVTVTSTATGCSSVTPPFTVKVNPVPSGFSIAANGACAGTPVQINYSGPQPAGWQYIWNTGLVGTTLSTEDAGKYQIRVINEFGCEARSNEVVVRPGPNVAAIPSGCHARCKPDSLCLPNIPGIVSWQWYKDGEPVIGANSANFIAQESGTYWAELTDNTGCSGTSDPLSLTLLDGYGSIAGQVWVDVNQSGTLDALDTLMPGVAVRLLRNSLPLDTLITNSAGGFLFADILSTDYTVQLLSGQFGPNWNIITGQAAVKLEGCDALSLANLLVQYTCPTRSSTLNLKACPGGSVVYQGKTIPVGGSQIFTYQVADGCDSTVTVTVSAHPISVIALALKTCPGTTLEYNGTQLAIGQSQSFVLKSKVTGCDSIVNVTVSALPTSDYTLNLYACPGKTVAYNGSNLAVGTTHSFTFKNYLNCDSVVTVTVSPLSTNTSTLTLRTCPGTTVPYAGANLGVGTVQNFTFPNAGGCDSVVTVTVLPLPTSTSTLNLKTCPGTTITYANTTLKAGDVRQFTFKNYVNCDSVVTVTVNEASTSSTTLQVDVCPGETYTYEGVTLLPGQTRDFVLLNSDGCDSVVTVVVKALPTVAFSLRAEPACPDAPSGSLTVLAPAGPTAPYRYSLDGVSYQDELIFKDLASNSYTVWLEDDNGCVFQQSMQVGSLEALRFSLLGGVLPCDSSAVTLAPILTSGDTTGLSYLWQNGLRTPSIQLKEAGPVWVELKNRCETLRQEASVVWADLPEGFSPVYVPNAFKPLALQPENYHFRPFLAPGLSLLSYEFAVFDRWGNLMFESNQSENAWDGAFRSDDMEPGVYVWYLKAQIGICGRSIAIKRSGDVTVVR